MRIPTIYLETTIFNFPFVDDAPQYRSDTLQLFDEIKAGKFIPYTSEYVVNELNDTENENRRKEMTDLISTYNINVIPRDKKTEELADLYVSAGVIPKKYETDALHIASATVAGLDCIVSLNFKHIVKHKTILETEYINLREGHKRIFIHTPAEVIND